MRKYLIAMEIVAVLAALGLAAGWFFLRAAPEARALQAALGKVPLPPGTGDFEIHGDDLEKSFFVSTTYPGTPNVNEIMAFYQAWFDENGWENLFPEDRPADGMLDYGIDKVSMNVTASNIRGQVFLMVIYREDEHTHEEFAALVTESAAPEALELVAEVTKTYAALNSYRDTGTLESVMDGDAPEHATFDTAFVRPDQLRFNYAENPANFHPTRHALAMNGDTVQSMANYDDAPEMLDDVSLAIAGLYGVTSTTSGNITELLLHDEDGGGLFYLADMTLLDDATLDDGTRCRRIQGSDFLGDVHTIWIGNDDFLIRRIESVTDAENRETITITPEANIDILTADLEFRRP